jgi:hypothetical protein
VRSEAPLETPLFYADRVNAPHRLFDERSDRSDKSRIVERHEEGRFTERICVRLYWDDGTVETPREPIDARATVIIRQRKHGGTVISR